MVVKEMNGTSLEFSRKLEEHSSHTAKILLLFDENLEILIDDSDGQQDT